LFKPYFYIICFSLFSATGFSQMHFHGKVIAEESNEPVAAASIYFNNTSIGTTTNESGAFSLPVPALSNLELIVSSVGFETIVYALSPGEPGSKTYHFKLKKKESLLQDILILPDATRKKYLDIFRKFFLGITEEAESSSIENQGAIYFTKSENEGQGFYAYSDTPLIIINNKLGYKIYFQLQEFYYNPGSGGTSFYGFTRYEEMGDKKRWIKNRRKAYYGSTMHFFRSLINDRLEQEFYKIFVIKEDSLSQANGQKNKMKMAFPVTAAQIMKADSAGNYIVSGTDKIMVQYNRDPASKEYLRLHTFIPEPLHMGFRSYLTSKSGTFTIDKNGVLLNPLSVFMEGYWIYEKAANLLPYNYDPETNN
jgi:CarboxypepD_reg-like domain